jgi:hypothetical protein
METIVAIIAQRKEKKKKTKTKHRMMSNTNFKILSK